MSTAPRVPSSGVHPSAYVYKLLLTLGQTPQSLGRLFRKALGQSPVEYLVPGCRPSLRPDPHDQLSEVLSFQHAHEGMGCVLESFHIIFPELQLPLLDPLAHLRKKLLVSVPVVVKYDEPFDGNSFDQNGPHERTKTVGARGKTDAVVPRD